MLHLVGVVGRACDERGRTDGVKLVQRKLLDVCEELRADDTPEANGGARGKERRANGTDRAAQRDEQHQAAYPQDVTGVVLYGTIVDYVRVQGPPVKVA